MKKLLSCFTVVGIAFTMMVNAPDSASAAQRTVSKTCSTNAVVTMRTGVPNPAIHTHIYTASSGAQQKRTSSSTEVFLSGSGYYKASVLVKTNTIESFSYVTPSCVTLG